MDTKLYVFFHWVDHLGLILHVAKTLVSAGGQANLKIWKQSIDGTWKEFAESELGD